MKIGIDIDRYRYRCKCKYIKLLKYEKKIFHYIQ